MLNTAVLGSFSVCNTEKNPDEPFFFTILPLSFYPDNSQYCSASKTVARDSLQCLRRLGGGGSAGHPSQPLLQDVQSKLLVLSLEQGEFLYFIYQR